MMTVLITASGIRDIKSMTNRVNVTKGSRQARYVTSGKVLAPTNVRHRFPVMVQRVAGDCFVCGFAGQLVGLLAECLRDALYRCGEKRA